MGMFLHSSSEMIPVYAFLLFVFLVIARNVLGINPQKLSPDYLQLTAGPIHLVPSSDWAGNH